MTISGPGDLVRLHIWVIGRVQGVGFRAFVLQSGPLFGLKGWVHNVGFNQVETVAEGRREVLERLQRLSRPDHVPAAWRRPGWNGKPQQENSKDSK